MFKLARTKQCAKCPWKVSTNPLDIPNEYCENKHKALKATIADPQSPNFFPKELKVMACHEEGNVHCISWLSNQLGVGNNIALRIKMLDCENIGDIKTFGDQHKRFEDTLPQNK
jgi:hypothetical protein